MRFLKIIKKTEIAIIRTEVYPARGHKLFVNGHRAFYSLSTIPGGNLGMFIAD